LGIAYWSIVALLLGGCIGSFLNVVIYRWPRDLSIRQPLRSFCPACEHTINGYDNVPVLSYLLLGGRCRHCQSSISRQYPLVELATAFVFLIVYQAFFVARQRFGIGDIACDWPMLLAHWVLLAGMIALVVMDLEAYLVDIRVTWIIAAAGMICHTIWTPATSNEWIRPAAPQAVFALAVTVGLGLATIIWRRRPDEPTTDEEPTEDDPEIDAAPVEPDAPTDDETLPEPPVSRTPAGQIGLICGLVIVIAYVIGMIVIGERGPLERPRVVPLYSIPGQEPTPAPLDLGAVSLAVGLGVVFMLLTLGASHPQPEADADIVEAITEEAPDSRRNALWELKFLTPAILLGVAALTWLALTASGNSTTLVDRILAFEPVDDWRPLRGLATALAGWVIGGAVGWLARIIFTLVLGKEALGMGDIHMLAAAGAVAGWPVAFLGFFLAACLALVAIVIIRLRRQSRMLPYGPWLAMAFLLATVFQDRILLALGVRWLFDPS